MFARPGESRRSHSLQGQKRLERTPSSILAAAPMFIHVLCQKLGVKCKRENNELSGFKTLANSVLPHCNPCLQHSANHLPSAKISGCDFLHDYRSKDAGTRPMISGQTKGRQKQALFQSVANMIRQTNHVLSIHLSPFSRWTHKIGWSSS